MSPIIAFIIKTIDISLGTAKTIYVNKERYFLGALMNAFSTFFYLIAIVELTKSNSMTSVLAMCVATFVGTYLPGVIIKKSDRDKLWIFDITSTTLENGKKFADTIREENLAVKTYISYDKNMEKVLSCKVYVATKDDSRNVTNLIPEGFKYMVYVPLENV